MTSLSTIVTTNGTWRPILTRSFSWIICRSFLANRTLPCRFLLDTILSRKLDFSHSNHSCQFLTWICFVFSSQYQSGGAGYVLSNEALKRFGSALSPINKMCPDTGVEDMDVGKCLRSINVDMGKSIDGRRERFHVESMQNHFNNKNLGWLKGWSQNVYLPGYDCCSDTSISYHRQTLSEMKLMKELWSRKYTFKDFYDTYSRLRQHLPQFVNSSTL